MIMYGPLTDEELNLIRGKLMMDHPPGHDIWKVFGHLDWLVDKLNDLDYDDTLGTEGWRRLFGLPEED